MVIAINGMAKFCSTQSVSGHPRRGNLKLRSELIHQPRGRATAVADHAKDRAASPVRPHGRKPTVSGLQ
jgi:hypothetical protein